MKTDDGEKTAPKSLGAGLKTARGLSATFRFERLKPQLAFLTLTLQPVRK